MADNSNHEITPRRRSSSCYSLWRRPWNQTLTTTLADLPPRVTGSAACRGSVEYAPSLAKFGHSSASPATGRSVTAPDDDDDRDLGEGDGNEDEDDDDDDKGDEDDDGTFRCDDSPSSQSFPSLLESLPSQVVCGGGDGASSFVSGSLVSSGNRVAPASPSSSSSSLSSLSLPLSSDGLRR